MEKHLKWMSLMTGYPLRLFTIAAVKTCRPPPPASTRNVTTSTDPADPERGRTNLAVGYMCEPLAPALLDALLPARATGAGLGAAAGQLWVKYYFDAI